MNLIDWDDETVAPDVPQPHRDPVASVKAQLATMTPNEMEELAKEMGVGGRDEDFPSA